MDRFSAGWKRIERARPFAVLRAAGRRAYLAYLAACLPTLRALAEKNEHRDYKSMDTLRFNLSLMVRGM